MPNHGCMACYGKGSYYVTQIDQYGNYDVEEVTCSCTQYD